MKPGKNQQVVMRLIDAVSDKDQDRIQSFLVDSNMQSGGSKEKKLEQKSTWELLFGAHKDVEEVDWQIEHLVEDESGKVITRGCLRYLVNGQWSEFPVNGAFEVKGSKIIQWY